MYSCGEQRKINGVGIILKKEWNGKVLEVKRICDRLMLVKLVAANGLVDII